jgi:hypothetical protein
MASQQKVADLLAEFERLKGQIRGGGTMPTEEDWKRMEEKVREIDAPVAHPTAPPPYRPASGSKA